MASVAFVSCSKTDMYEENKQYVAEQEKNEYRTNYVQKYGEIAADQSWDFSSLSGAMSATRAAGSFSYETLWPAGFFWSFIDNDLAGVKSKIANAEVKEFNPYLAVELYPAYSYVAKSNDYDYYHIAVCYNGQEKDIYKQGVNVGLEVLNKGWRTLGRLGKSINSKGLSGASNVYWALYPTNAGVFSGEKIVGNIEDYKIDSYKEFKVNGRTYWAFRVGANGSYSDLICRVMNVDPVKPIQKRYLIEDLGSKKDFDFNDVVVDVYQAIDGSQKAIIRAMGGTIDFTLQIGSTTWQKGVDGVAAGYNVETMYNTENPVWDDVLAEFTVKDWNPSTNNVTLTANSVNNEDVIIKIPFPREGEVPMIIAFDTEVDWQKERVSLPKDWYTIPKNNGEAE